MLGFSSHVYVKYCAKTGMISRLQRSMVVPDLYIIQELDYCANMLYMFRPGES